MKEGALFKPVALSGSDGEHELQEKWNTTPRAHAFYRHQVLDYLNPSMQAFVTKQEMMFVGTADRHGEADTSFRAGLAGFIRVLDDKTLAYPEYRGNGVMSSLGNIFENPHVGLLFLDFTEGKIGLHVNGRARIVENYEFLRDAAVGEPSARISLLRRCAVRSGGLWYLLWKRTSIAPSTFHACRRSMRKSIGERMICESKAATTSGRNPLRGRSSEDTYSQTCS